MGYDAAFRFRNCPWCGLRDAQMNPVATNAHTSGAGSQAGDTKTRWWSTLSCPRCAGIILLETNAEKASPGQIFQVIPREHENLAVSHLPEDVERYYRDSIRILDAGVPDAAAVQLRRTLEAAASHNGIDKGSLVQRIRKLIDAGLITSGFAAVLDHVRVVGNIGAHASDERLEEPDVRRALRFTTQVLRNLFEIPAELANIDESDSEKDAGSEEAGKADETE